MLFHHCSLINSVNHGQLLMHKLREYLNRIACKEKKMFAELSRFNNKRCIIILRKLVTVHLS